jgi:hypothetical protein
VSTQIRRQIERSPGENARSAGYSKQPKDSQHGEQREVSAAKYHATQELTPVCADNLLFVHASYIAKWGLYQQKMGPRGLVTPPGPKGSPS